MSVGTTDKWLPISTPNTTLLPTYSTAIVIILYRKMCSANATLRVVVDVVSKSIYRRIIIRKM